MSPTTRGLQSWCYAVAMREDPIVAVAGLVVGLESQVPSIYRRQTPTLREKYGFTDEEVEFFDLHIVSDEIHGERGYQIVLRARRHGRTAAALPEDLRDRRPDAPALHHGALSRLRGGRTAADRADRVEKDVPRGDRELPAGLTPSPADSPWTADRGIQEPHRRRMDG